MHNKAKQGAKLLVTVMLLSASTVFAAADDYETMKAEIETLKKEVAELRALLKQQAQQVTPKEEVQELKQEVRQARIESAEWKEAESVVHVAGYAAVGYANQESENDAFNLVSFNPIFHYQYRDLVLLEAELETAIEEDGETEVDLEYLSIDLFLNDYMIFVGGKFLSPLGYFRQNLHPAWINKLPSISPGFAKDAAAPQNAVGVELRGGFYPLLNGMRANYALYIANGPELKVEEGKIVAVDTSGFPRDIDGSKVGGGRLGFLPIPNLEIGLSGAVGNVGIEGEDDRDYYVIGSDLTYQWKGLDLRGEYIRQAVGSLAGSVAPDSASWQAWYVQAAYQLLPYKWEPVLRYADFDGPGEEQDQRQWALGINYLFTGSLIAKLAYEFNDGLNGTARDADRLLLQLAYGF